MTYRAWNLKPLDRAALRELTQAIAEQATEELEYNAQNDEPWSEQKYAAALAAQQKENALLAGVLTARGITDPTEALTLLAGEEELSDPSSPPIWTRPASASGGPLTRARPLWCSAIMTWTA